MRTLAAFSLATLLAASAALADDHGVIKGRLIYKGTPPAPKVEVKKGDPAAKDAKVCAVKDILNQDLVVDPATKGIRYGVAFLVKPEGKNPEAEKAMVSKAPKVEIDQKGCEFIPHVEAIFQDQKVVFKSSDAVAHNVRYAGFKNTGANVNVPPNSKFEPKQALKAENTRPIKINCDLHPWMNASLFVFDHPFFAVTGTDGSFEIHGVPAGAQHLIVWQEKVGFVTPNKGKGQDVTVKAGETTDVGDIEMAK